MTIFIVYDIETRNTDRAIPYNMTFYRLKKLAGRYNRDLTPYEMENCKKDILAFDGDTCVSNAFDFLIKLKENHVKLKKLKLLIIIYNYTRILEVDSILG